jgi:chromate transport protein ChrA
MLIVPAKYSVPLEIATGLALAGLVALLPPIIALTVVSVAYELWRDSNGWSWSDVGWRELGIVAGFAIARAVSRA